MRNISKAVAALVAVAAPAVAEAAVTFNVSGLFNTGGTLTGTFTTNDALTQVTAINLMTSANGAFQATTYASAATIDNQQLPTTFRLTVNGPPGKQLQLVFSPPLNASGGTFGGNSFEAQQIQGAGNRSLTGRVTVAGAVPEPAAWAMMLTGFGVVGYSMRRRTARLAFS